MINQIFFYLYLQESGKKNFLIDGFPRNKDNLDGWMSEVNLPLLMHPLRSLTLIWSETHVSSLIILSFLQVGPEKANVKFVLFFDCDKSTCVDRCLQRGALGSGRTDDNRDSLEKR